MLVVPTQMTFIPVLRLYNKLSLSGTFVGLWLVHTGYGLPFSIFMLHTFFQGSPMSCLKPPTSTVLRCGHPFSAWPYPFLCRPWLPW